MEVGAAPATTGGDAPRHQLTRDELVECTALLAAVRDGRLDLLEPPVAPLDVLTQQLVAEVAAAGERDVEDLWTLVRSAAPYAAMALRRFSPRSPVGKLSHATPRLSCTVAQ